MASKSEVSKSEVSTFIPMRVHTERDWHQRAESQATDVGQADHVADSPGISSLQTKLLTLRGIVAQEQAQAFLHARLKDLPDPLLLPDMPKAVERLLRAIDAGEYISIHGDYDVDGISATALLYTALEHFGARVTYNIPLRQRDGYGLNAAALERDAAAGVSLVISVDCGISALEEARLACELGIDLIITDHHQPGTQLPPAYACINPWLPDSAYPYPHLCGAGVAFMLMVGLSSALRCQNKLDPAVFDIRRLLDLVALATIADIVPLTGVNRILVRTGLPLLEGDYRPGIARLREVAGVSAVNAGVVGFRLAPRLNAAGRLEDAAAGVELLLSSDLHHAQAIAAELERCNTERREIEETTLRHALERVSAELSDSRRTIVLADPNWHSGVIGIVASRLVELFYRPVILIAIDAATGVGKGSGRSIRGFNLHQALNNCAESLQGYGGHEMAAGLSIDPADVEAFAHALEHYALEQLQPEDLHPRITYDLLLLLDDITPQLHEEIQLLAPFGMGNPEPVFMSTDLNVQQASVVGGGHLRFRVQSGGCSLPCIGFGLAHKLDILQGRIDVLYQVDTNTWQGRTSLQLKIKDVRPCSN
ncbi:MAG: single-stranded-DNA-specific exonuclease RecJ [Desulfuromonadaceae bacterium]|nr:single-stranded-DNA-specific exonuclease RecJ [Desulfuromonadaceae bacterium]